MKNGGNDRGRVCGLMGIVPHDYWGCLSILYTYKIKWNDGYNILN